LLVSASVSFAQRSPIRIEVDGIVDTSDSQISQVIRLWENYLNSKPDSSYINPYWSESEQSQLKPFDLVPHTWWGISLYEWLPHCRTQVLSVSRIRDSYIIRTMFYNTLPEDSGKVSVISVIQTGARLENRYYKLCNVLPINTRDWTKEQVGSIKFVFPPEHQFDRMLAERMSRFIDSLADVWQIAHVPTDYYFADDLDRVAKALGFDYWPAEGNNSGASGFTDVPNHIVYAGGSNEWYPHEFVHIYINPLFPNAHQYFLEGYATLAGGSKGHELSWHLKRNYEYLKSHPEIDVLTFKGVDVHEPAQYFVGGLLCKMAEEKGGIPMIRKLMTYGKKDEDLYRAIQDIFGIDKQHINDFLRKGLAEYDAK
jgi:hypothetical protein